MESAPHIGGPRFDWAFVFLQGHIPVLGQLVRFSVR